MFIFFFFFFFDDELQENFSDSGEIRHVWNKQNGQCYFSVLDVVKVLTDSSNPRQYLKKTRTRDPELNASWGTICTQAEMIATDGKRYKTTAATMEGMLRIIQSIPSPKAEPFKRWLAKVGAERLEEIKNPELAGQRMQDLYKSKGYSDDWIKKRVRGIAVRDELTGEWKNRGVKEGHEYGILTAEISKATFGFTPSQYKQHKGLEDSKENLRDHMSDLELIFTMLGEASTTEIARNVDAQGFRDNKKVAFKGGSIAGNARKELEIESGRKVVTTENFKLLNSSLPDKR